MRFTRLAAASLLTIALAAGCGNSKAGTSTAAAPTESTSGKSATTDLGSGGGDFCEFARKQAKSFLGEDDTALKDAIAQIFDPSKAAQGKAALKVYVQTARAQNADFIAKAPAELKKDLTVIKAASDKLFDAMAKADYDITKIDTGAFSAADTPELKASAERLSAYLKRTCGMDLGTNG